MCLSKTAATAVVAVAGIVAIVILGVAYIGLTAARDPQSIQALNEGLTIIVNWSPSWLG